MLIGRRRTLLLSLFLVLTVPATAATQCPIPPAPIISLSLNGFYSDKNGSIVDPDRLRAYIAAAKPLRHYYAHLRSTNQAADSDASSCSCLLHSLTSWARADALRDVRGSGEKRWAVTALLGVYLARGSNFGSCEFRNDVEAWFERLAEKNRPAHFSEARAARSNNIDYWGAAGSALLYIATGRTEAGWTFALSVYRNALDRLDGDNLLPNERARGVRQWKYHFFALTPLLLIAESARACGIDLYRYGDSKLERLVEATLAGHRQSLASTMPDEEYAAMFIREMPDVSRVWINLAFERMPDRLPHFLAAAKAKTTWYLGGDVEPLLSALAGAKGRC